MTCQGHIRKGTIALEKPVDLPDGARVEVEVTPVATKTVKMGTIATLAEGINYDFESVQRLREKSKL
jgi:hypothetical protein